MRTAATKSTQVALGDQVARAGGFFSATRSAGLLLAGDAEGEHAPRRPDQTLREQTRRPAGEGGRPHRRTGDADATGRTGCQRRRAVAANRSSGSARARRASPPTPRLRSSSAATGGQALSSDVRAFMEPRLGADFGDVRVHTDESAASLSNHLSARAFTYRNHVFFGAGPVPAGHHRRPPPARPRAHAHDPAGRHRPAQTEQPTPEVQRPPRTARRGAHDASGSPPAVQRLGMQDALDYFADKANYIPGFRMLTLVLGFNPINMRRTDRTAANFLRALIELVPGGALITQRARQPRRDQQGRRLGGAEGRHARATSAARSSAGSSASSTRSAGPTSSTSVTCGIARSGSSPTRSTG